MLFRQILPTSTALLCPFVLSSLVFAQAARTVPPRDHQGRPALLPVVFHGIVLDPDGAPAAGALVMSSAGGKTVADLQGRYRFEADVPPEAERVQVTAILGDAGSLIAHTSVELGAPSRFVRVEPLLLAPGATCPPVWLPTFGGQPGVDGTINALTVFDDGTGPALYVGGEFTTAGGVVANRIAKWDGSSWSALSSGLRGGGGTIEVNALTVFDPGTGPALYAGGTFTIAGDLPANRIAKWDGTSWSALGSGANSTVNALTVFDDGSGPALYAGGRFSMAGGVVLNASIASWDGSSWSALGGKVRGELFALSVFDDGAGPALHAGGSFTVFDAADMVVGYNVAKWDGSSWSGLSSVGGSVFALTVFDDGTSAALYAGGYLASAGGLPVNRIAKWDGSIWASLGSGIDGPAPVVMALTAFDDGSGAVLCAGGYFDSAGGVAAKNIAQWNGTSWASLGSGTGWTNGLAVFDSGIGSSLYTGGYFNALSTGVAAAANNIARWDGSSWSTLGSGLNARIQALQVFDDGNGPGIYAGGFFFTVDGVVTNRIARWDGSSWSALGSGLGGGTGSPGPLVNALTVFDDGGGPALYAAGNFTTAGGVAANHIARWDGSSWAALGSGMSGWVHALTVFDDGNGPALYAAGMFETAGGRRMNYISKWDGSNWTALSGGMNGWVWALTVFDDGTGPALYVAGDFTSAGGDAANFVVKWDGSNWSPLGSGTNLPVYALTVFDHGSGPALHAGGGFTSAGGVAASFVAKWDGATWSALGGGVGSSHSLTKVEALKVFDDGSGPALYAGGLFQTAGGLAANNVARWDGSSWAALGSGVGGGLVPGPQSLAFMVPSVRALTAFDDGHGPALFVGGTFGSALDSGDSFLAKWGCSLVTKHDKTRRR